MITFRQFSIGCISVCLILLFTGCTAKRQVVSSPGMEILRPEATLPSTLPDTLETQSRMPVLDFPDDRHIPYLTYRKTACYGNCPEFFVKFYADGTFEYRGKANVERLGTTGGTFDTSILQNIIDFARTSELHRLKPTYPDFSFKSEFLSSTVISIRLRSWQFHTFTWWFGEPSELRYLESTINILLQSVEWDD